VIVSAEGLAFPQDGNGVDIQGVILNKVGLPEFKQLPSGVNRQITNMSKKDILLTPAKIKFLFQFRVYRPHITEVGNVIEIPFIIA
jgi:hypothetical protein